ncbi:hypothetical protein Tco_0212980 [Tanacetum coccineum]
MNRVSLGVRFDGCFMHAPLRYQDGKKLILAIRRMAYEEFSEFLKNTVGFAHSLYYKVPNVELETGLVRVSNSKELYYMFDVANAYGWLEMYVNHHDMKLNELVNWAENEVEYDEESMQTEEDAVQIKQIEIGLTDQVERATQDEAVQGEDNQQQQQDNPVDHDNPETAIYVE